MCMYVANPLNLKGGQYSICQDTMLKKELVVYLPMLQYKHHAMNSCIKELLWVTGLYLCLSRVHTCIDIVHIKFSQVKKLTGCINSKNDFRTAHVYWVAIKHTNCYYYMASKIGAS